jgi:hypothetical protein
MRFALGHPADLGGISGMKRAAQRLVVVVTPPTTTTTTRRCLF